MFRVWHAGLLHKLSNYLLPNSFLKLTCSYLYRRTFQVRCGNILSSRKTIFCGVPEGSVLGPKYFNDMPVPSYSNILK
ncbi:putative RNA-directed DNA polymerase from transposon X-element, partial [Stegodyphus mimosarum]